MCYFPKETEKGWLSSFHTLSRYPVPREIIIIPPLPICSFISLSPICHHLVMPVDTSRQQPTNHRFLSIMIPSFLQSHHRYHQSANNNASLSLQYSSPSLYRTTRYRTMFMALGTEITAKKCGGECRKESIIHQMTRDFEGLGAPFLPFTLSLSSNLTRSRPETSCAIFCSTTRVSRGTK